MATKPSYLTKDVSPYLSEKSEKKNFFQSEFDAAKERLAAVSDKEEMQYKKTNKEIKKLENVIKQLTESIKAFKTKSPDLKQIVTLGGEIKLIEIIIDEELKKKGRSADKIKARDEKIAGYKKEISKIQRKIDKVKNNKDRHFDSFQKLKSELQEKENKLEKLKEEVRKYNKLQEDILNIKDSLKRESARKLR